MAQTGIETSSIIKGIADEIDPGVIIVIDALAARTHRDLIRQSRFQTGELIRVRRGKSQNRDKSDNIGVPVIAWECRQ